MTSVSASHIVLIPTQPVGSGRPQRESNPGPPHQESRALPAELPPPPPIIIIKHNQKFLEMKLNRRLTRRLYITGPEVLGGPEIRAETSSWKGVIKKNTKSRNLIYTSDATYTMYLCIFFGFNRAFFLL